jgi:hypothetical protein
MSVAIVFGKWFEVSGSRRQVWFFLTPHRDLELLPGQLGLAVRDFSLSVYAFEGAPQYPDADDRSHSHYNVRDSGEVFGHEADRSDPSGLDLLKVFIFEFVILTGLVTQRPVADVAETLAFAASISVVVSTVDQSTAGSK